MLSPLIALTLLAAGPAVPEAYAPVFTGALVSTYADGRKAKLWLESDGAFSGQGRTGRRNSGSWTLETKGLCMRQSRPFPVPFKFCTPLPASLTQPWAAKAPTGEAVTVTFVAGDRP
ncbi:hypothetical protein BH09PSE2_BH09PSE2_11400 [soil metagenome]